MKLFNPDNASRSEKHKKIYAFYALAYTIVDFSAAVLFIVGSILFFKQSTTYAATWLFLIGSIFFGLRPTTTLLRELAYIRAGDYDDVHSN
ncbi:MAG: YrhK family protein [Nitrospirales bacterium]|nr:YrhK family protein [Nitrospira sp.]MDR4501115.1 YrhK family protein [Nitrospirales bacterium]